MRRFFLKRKSKHSLHGRRRNCARGSRDLMPVAVKGLTGFLGHQWRTEIPEIDPRHIRVSETPIAGDAPKNFIQVREALGKGRDDPATWPFYIAKVGHKWYPGESITEQLMTRVGECFGLRLANSRLIAMNGQIRFLSRYFLKPEESLVHGAEIVAGYLEDEKFVEDVEQVKLEKEIFTFEVFCSAIGALFAEHKKQLLAGFVRMIGFDAIVGNQDRHLYNWGVIVHATGRRPVRFAPIYDTARGLFWNEPEDRLTRFDSQDALNAYVERAHPLIGWEGERSLNHFRLISKVAALHPSHRGALVQLASPSALSRAEEAIDKEFAELLSPTRRILIKRCLARRLERFVTSLEN